MTKATTLWLTAALVTTTFFMFIPTSVAAHCESVRSNDCLADAPDLGEARPRRFSAQTGGSGVEAGEPLLCGATANTIWVEFTAVTSGVARFSRLPEYANQPATVVNIFTGTQVSNLTWQGCGSYSGGETTDASIECVAGATYKVQFASLGNATGMSAFELTGCGMTGARTTSSDGNQAIVHENVVQEEIGVAADVDAAITLRPGSTSPTQAVAEGHIALAVASGVSSGSESVGFYVVPIPGPPNPGPGGLPPIDRLVGYPGQVGGWAQSDPVQIG